MKYIKDLYAKKPTLVKAWVRKMFDVTSEQRLFDIKSLNEDINENCVLLGVIDLNTRDVAEILLEDFDVCYGDEHLKMDDKRLQYYLIQMTRNCDGNYIQGFHRAAKCKEAASGFNAATYNIESKMAKAASLVSAQDSKVL